MIRGINAQLSRLNLLSSNVFRAFLLNIRGSIHDLACSFHRMAQPRRPFSPNISQRVGPETLSIYSASSIASGLVRRRMRPLG